MATATKAGTLTVGRDELKRRLGALMQVVPSRTTLPVLGCVRLQVGDGEAWVSATDLDVHARLKLDGHAEGEGDVLLPAKRLYEVVRQLPDVSVTIAGDRIRCGPVKMHFTDSFGRPSDEMPDPHQVEWGETVGWEPVRRAWGKTAWAVSDEGSRPILNGVLTRWTGSTLTSVGTNGHHLGVCQEPMEGMGDMDLIVPIGFVRAAHKIVTGEMVEIGTSKDHPSQFFGIRTENAALTGRMVSGTYPNYGQVMPERGAVTGWLKVTRADLISCTARLLAFSGDTATKRVVFELKDGKPAVVKSLFPDIGEYEEELESRFEGKDAKLGFAAGYLSLATRYLKGPGIKIGVTKPERAARIESDGDPGYTGLLMPLRLD